MCLADMGSAKKRHSLGRSCPELPVDKMSDSWMAGKNPDRKLSVKCLQLLTRNSPERRISRIVGPIMAGSIQDCKALGISNLSLIHI